MALLEKGVKRKQMFTKMRNLSADQIKMQNARRKKK